MNISNLSELINAEILNEGSISSVLGFALSLDEVKPGFAFFTKDKEEAKQAILKGAFCIISTVELEILDKELFYLIVQDLESALFRLLRFLSEEKALNFVLCDSFELDFAKAFSLKILSGNVLNDFKELINAKNNSFFFALSEKYLLKLCANFKRLKSVKFELLNTSSLFFTSLVCDENLYFKNLKFPYVYAEIFAKFVFFIRENKLNLSFNEKKLDFLKIYFVDSSNKFCEFGTSSRAFLLAKNESHFEFLSKSLKHIKGFKIALKNSLFCDFSYANLENLLEFKDFSYCLILENETLFEEIFLKENKTQSLF